MHQFILENEIPVRLSLFFGIFALVALWEWKAPRRVLTVSKSLRWINNIGLVFLNSFILRVLFPAAAVGMAVFASNQGMGIFHYLDWPTWLEILLAVVILDFFIWLQHVVVHAVPLLWRLHRVHHADLDYDVTTGARFHPLEIILSMIIKFAAIILLGPAVLAVILFEILLNATAMFNHGNIRLPEGVDRVLRLFVVTPDMHRVHHSVEEDETNSNFGFNLPWWDRMFGTYKAQPDAGHSGMVIGIHHARDPKQVNTLPGMLTLPFKGHMKGQALDGYVINRRSWPKPGEHG